MKISKTDYYDAYRNNSDSKQKVLGKFRSLSYELYYLCKIIHKETSTKDRDELYSIAVRIYDARHKKATFCTKAVSIIYNFVCGRLGTAENFFERIKNKCNKPPAQAVPNVQINSDTELTISKESFCSHNFSLSKKVSSSSELSTEILSSSLTESSANSPSCSYLSLSFSLKHYSAPSLSSVQKAAKEYEQLMGSDLVDAVLKELSYLFKGKKISDRDFEDIEEFFLSFKEEQVFVILQEILNPRYESSILLNFLSAAHINDDLQEKLIVFVIDFVIKKSKFSILEFYNLNINKRHKDFIKHFTFQCLKQISHSLNASHNLSMLYKYARKYMLQQIHDRIDKFTSSPAIMDWLKANKRGLYLQYTLDPREMTSEKAIIAAKGMKNDPSKLAHFLEPLHQYKSSLPNNFGENFKAIMKILNPAEIRSLANFFRLNENNEDKIKLIFECLNAEQLKELLKVLITNNVDYDTVVSFILGIAWYHDSNFTDMIELMPENSWELFFKNINNLNFVLPPNANPETQIFVHAIKQFLICHLRYSLLSADVERAKIILKVFSEKAPKVFLMLYARFNAISRKKFDELLAG